MVIVDVKKKKTVVDNERLLRVETDGEPEVRGGTLGRVGDKGRKERHLPRLAGLFLRLKGLLLL